MKKVIFFFLLLASTSLSAQTLTVVNNFDCAVTLNIVADEDACSTFSVWLIPTIAANSTQTFQTTNINWIGAFYSIPGNGIGDPANCNNCSPCNGGTPIWTNSFWVSNTLCHDGMTLTWMSGGCGNGNALVTIDPF